MPCTSQRTACAAPDPARVAQARIRDFGVCAAPRVSAGAQRAMLIALGACIAVLLSGMAAPPAASAVSNAAESGANSNVRREHKVAAKKRSRTGETPFGREGDPRKVKRVLTIETSDAMRYFPDQIRVKKGQTVRLIVRNNGQLPHEVVIGTMDDLKKHAALARQQGEGELEAPNIARVAPGGTGRIDWHFTKAGEFYYGCLTPGHFDAGMIGTIVVR